MNIQIYKDRDLSDTIKTIKHILENNNIKVTEVIQEGFDGLWSVRLTIDDINLGTNGKGLSQEASLASAYGELIERIQNFALYKFLFPIPEHLLPNNYFLYFPDEIKSSTSNIQDDCACFGEAIKGLDGLLLKKLILLHSDYEQKNNLIFLIPYRDYLREKNVYVPSKLAEHIYGTNGMASGNTYSEAMVQAICEVFERYSNKLMYNENMTPPDIPIENLPLTTINLIRSIELRSNYEVILKDCSLGLGLPVVAIILVDKNCGKYFVKFGAHPMISIAVERSLTELFQGRKISNSRMWLKSFSFEEITDKERNYRKIFRSGDGVYPYSLFGNICSYNHTNIWFNEKYDNNDSLLEYLLSIIKKHGWNLYVKDVSFLGFPCVHIIIPEISYINIITSEYVDEIIEYNEIKSHLRNLKNCSEKELDNILEFVDKIYKSPNDIMWSLIGLPFDEYFQKELQVNTNVTFFKFLLNYSLKRYKLSLVFLDEYINTNYLSNVNSGVYYRCLREVINAVFVKNIDRCSARSIINKVYKKEVTDEVFSFINSNALDHFLHVDCYNCDKCDYKDKCYYHKIADFHLHMSRCCFTFDTESFLI